MKNKKTLTIAAASAFGLVFLLYLLSLFVRLPLLGVHAESAIPSESGMAMIFQREWLDSAAFEPGAMPVFALPPVVLSELTSFEQTLGEQLHLPKEGKVVVTVHPTKSTGTNVLFIYDDHRGLDIGDALADGFQLKTAQFKGHPIYSGKTEAGSFSAARFRNLLLLSRHAYLIENAIGQLLSPRSSVCRDGAFRRLQKELPAQPHTVQLYWNLTRFRTAFSGLLNPAALPAAGRLSSFGKWVHMQVPLPGADSTTVWRGGIYPNTKDPLCAAIADAKALPFRNSFENIPAGMGVVAWFAFSGFQPQMNADKWSKYFKPWIGQEVAFSTGQALLDNSFEQFVLFKVADGEKAETLLPKLALTEGDSSVSNYQMFSLYHQKGDAVNGFLGSAKQWPETWYTLLGEYALFSNSRAGVERWLDQYVIGNTLSKDARFLKTILELPVTANGFVSFESGKAWQQLSAWLDPDKLKNLAVNPLGMDLFAATLRKKGNMFELEIATQSDAGPAARSTASVLWRVPLEAPLASSPFTFYHPETGEYLVFAQDAGRQLYLISRSGRVLWKKPFTELINSEIQPLDLHNDGDVQLAFSTRTGIHLLNIQGEEMPGYPIELLVPATNGVTVVDFFKSHDYSFFIACENEKAYGFDEEGLPLEGWRPRDSVGMVTHPMQHFQARGMDFLVFLNDEPALRVFRRNGQPRFDEVLLEGKFLSPPGWQVSRQSSRIVACNDKGRAWVVNLSGGAFGLSLKAGNSTDTRFIFEDVVGDNRKDYIVLSSQDLAVYNYEGSKFVRSATHRFANRQEDLFGLHWQNAPKSLIGTVDPVRNQINILDGKGRLLPQFPLAGDTRFQVVDLLEDGKPVLIVGHNEEVYAYLLRN
ncbi:MAG: hypothetical protein Kow0027_10170 [Saprospiraceae bacterium]